MSSSDTESKEEEKALVYWLKSSEDLKNVLAISPTAPVVHQEGERNLYVLHTPGRIVFMLETEDPIEDTEIPFKGDNQVNLVEVERVQTMTTSELSNFLADNFGGSG